MSDDAPTRPRRPRADAIRNRERLLEAATAVFTRGGTGAGLDAVAREARVGIGTLYRHFPTREALYEAVYRREVEQLVELAGRFATEDPPMPALRRWFAALVGLVATKKGMGAALALGAHKPPELMAYSASRLQQAIGMLLRRAVEAGEARADLSPGDLLMAVIGLCTVQEGPGWQEQTTRLLDVLLDGLRQTEAGGVVPTAPRRAGGTGGA